MCEVLLNNLMALNAAREAASMDMTVYQQILAELGQLGAGLAVRMFFSKDDARFRQFEDFLRLVSAMEQSEVKQSGLASVSAASARDLLCQLLQAVLEQFSERTGRPRSELMPAERLLLSSEEVTEARSAATVPNAIRFGSPFRRSNSGLLKNTTSGGVDSSGISVSLTELMERMRRFLAQLTDILLFGESLIDPDPPPQFVGKYVTFEKSRVRVHAAGHAGAAGPQAS